MTKIIEELLFTTKLLLAERKEDLLQYKKLSYRKSIKEKKEAGICWYPVQLVKVRWAFTDKLVIELEKSGDEENDVFQSGKTVALFSNLGGNDNQNSSVNGIINTVRRKKMIISLHTDKIPEWIHEGKLGVDLMFDETSYRIMEETMEKVIQAKGNRLEDLRDKLLGEKVPAFGNQTISTRSILNTGQNSALSQVQAALDLAIVHGPPGTGKTTTLVQAVVDALLNYPQVLVCAPSNAAVDLLVEKLMPEGVNVLRLGHPARVDDEIISQTLDAKITLHSNYKDYKKLKKTAEECRRKAGKFKRTFGANERAERKNQFEEAKRLYAEADNLYNYILHSILSTSQVITCTLVGAASSLLKGLRFPVVFIDEAAQGLEPATWIPVLLADKVVMAGDHCQLPPTIKSRDAALKGLQETLFEKCIRRQPEVATMLSLQYRMAAPIMAFPNRYFYRGNLEAAANTREHFLKEGEEVFAFIDTAGSGFGEYLDKESMSVQNNEEAQACLEILTNLLKRVGLKNASGEPWQVGLIAPYRAQVRALKSRVQEDAAWVLLKSMGQNLVISSVDGFQGQEKDIILISLTRSNPSGEIGFLSDTRRMNVALTRAKRKLMVIGDSATLSVHPFYRDLIQHVQEKGYYKSIYEYINF